MKKFLLCSMCIFYSSIAMADICYDISENVASIAYDIISKQTEIYKYCSICPEAKPEKIIISDIQKSNPILINGEAIDLAHIYYKKDNQFINLAIASKCISDGQYNITATLKDLQLINRNSEKDRIEAQKQAKKYFQACFKENASNKKHLATVDIIERNSLYRECIVSKIKEEIRKSFTLKEQESIINSLEGIQKNVFSFYSKFHQTNKYCTPSCGSISLIMPYIDEGTILEKILEDTIYLNITKGEY